MGRVEILKENIVQKKKWNWITDSSITILKTNAEQSLSKSKVSIQGSNKYKGRVQEFFFRLSENERNFIGILP